MAMRWRTRLAAGCAAMALLGALGGCSAGSGGMRDTLGLSAPPPDPFLTVARAPLELPPDMQALPTPRLGAPSPREPDAQALAQQALAGASVVAAGTSAAGASAAGTSAGEAALVSAAGEVDGAVRETIVAEAAPPERRFGLDSLFGIPIEQDPEAAAQRLDPIVESDRLRGQGTPAPVPPAAP